MAGKGYRPASPELKAQARAMRKEGQSIESIGRSLGVSSGAVSGWCRDIGVSRIQQQKEAPRSQNEGNKKDTTGAVVAGPYEDDTKELANRFKRAEIQEKLDLIEARKDQRKDIDDLRLRERKLLLQMDEARLGASKGDSSVVGELTELRRELAELRESRHQMEITQIQVAHQSEMRRLEQMMAGIQRTGLSSYDIMSQMLSRGENLAIMAGDKIDKFVKSGREDKVLMTALSLGLTPSEYALLLQGEELIPTREDFEVGRRYRAHQDGVPYVEPEPGEYEGMVSLVERHNLMWQAAMDKAQRARGRGGSSVVRTKPEQAPALGEPELVSVVEAKANVVDVKCQHCGKLVALDLLDGKLKTSPFAKCPECQATLDISQITGYKQPVEDRSPKPYCYVAGQDGSCNSELKGPEQCANCQWFKSTIVPMAYE